MNDNKCVVCGRAIPEGRLVCPCCGCRYYIDWDAEDKRLHRRKLMRNRLLQTGIIAAAIAITAAVVLAVEAHAVTPRVLPMPPDLADVPMVAIDEPAYSRQDAPQDDLHADKQLYRITAYCPCTLCCGDSADGITASGTTATQGRTVAVDPDVIPLGSDVMIDGHAYTAEDVGGAIKGNRVDVYFNSHEDALAFGVRWEVIQ